MGVNFLQIPLDPFELPHTRPPSRTHVRITCCNHAIKEIAELEFREFFSLAHKAGWSENRKGDGTRGRGIGFAKYKNLACYVAVVADVEVDRGSGMVRVPRAWAAVDCGLIINPDGLANQIEGGIVQSVSWTVMEEVRFDKNGILARDWASYPILTMPDAPKVEVELINRPNERSLGAGEGSQGPAVAAVVNAFANATGKRIRDLPLKPERVKAVLGSSGDR